MGKKKQLKAGRRHAKRQQKPEGMNRRSLLAGALGAGALGVAGAVAWRGAFGGNTVRLRSALDTLAELPATGRLPAVFVGHGTPWQAIRPGEYTEVWEEVGRALPKPEAMLMISAHWITPGSVLVTAGESPRMNYDMYGFPEEMYRLQYPAPGSPELAAEVTEALSSAAGVRPDRQWGYDHGTWLPLMYMFPDAGVPLVQLSIDYAQPPAYHFELARHLRSLRSRGVLVIASGNLVHNLRRRGEPGAKPFDWAEEFDARMTGYIKDGDYQAVVDFLELGSLASRAHPTYDHFLPLLYVLGASENGESVSSFNESFQEPSVSMRSFVVA